MEKTMNTEMTKKGVDKPETVQQRNWQAPPFDIYENKDKLLLIGIRPKAPSRRRMTKSATLVRRLGSPAERQQSIRVESERLLDVVPLRGVAPVDGSKLQHLVLRPAGQQAEQIAQVTPRLNPEHSATG
jgi:hypothetical protein